MGGSESRGGQLYHSLDDYLDDLTRLATTSASADEVSSFVSAFLDRKLSQYEQEQVQRVLDKREKAGDERCRSEMAKLLQYFRVHKVRGGKEVAELIDLDSVIRGGQERSMIESPSGESSDDDDGASLLPRLMEQTSPTEGKQITRSQIRIMRHRLRGQLKAKQRAARI